MTYLLYHNTPEMARTVGWDLLPEYCHGDAGLPYVLHNYKAGKFYYMAADATSALRADYADLGVSTGYIGNVYHGPTRDDRSFRVFTQVLVKRMAMCQYRDTMTRETEERACLHVFTVPHGHKGLYEGPVEYDTPAIREQLDELRAQVAAGAARVAL